MSRPGVSVVIPTYQRGEVLLNTLRYLINLHPAPSEILVVDQTQEHGVATVQALRQLTDTQQIRWIQLSSPSITHAMNVGILEANNEILLFLDDDIIPGSNLIRAHLDAHYQDGFNVVAGQVLQSGEEPQEGQPVRGSFRFCSNRRQNISELMAGNFSIQRSLAMSIGGFDENFVNVAYRFETEFAERLLAADEKILFEPAAGIRHLKEPRGGTRAFGVHLTTINPSHAVGAYYYLIRSSTTRYRALKILGRPFREIRTRFHMLHPWWLLPKLLGELLGFAWAVGLAVKGPKLLPAGERCPAVKRV